MPIGLDGWQLRLFGIATRNGRRLRRGIGVGSSTVYRAKQRLVEEDLESAPSEVPRRGTPPIGYILTNRSSPL